MSFIYDLIMHLIAHYDIRSRDFRDSISSYIGARTSHFQHELFHFLLSGMGMEEYDRVAEYPSSTNRTTQASNFPSTSTSMLQPRNVAPEVITIDSEDENDEEAQNSSRNMPSCSRKRKREDDISDDVIIVESSGLFVLQ